MAPMNLFSFKIFMNKTRLKHKYDSKITRNVLIMRNYHVFEGGELKYIFILICSFKYKWNKWILNTKATSIVHDSVPQIRPVLQSLIKMHIHCMQV